MRRAKFLLVLAAGALGLGCLYSRPATPRIISEGAGSWHFAPAISLPGGGSMARSVALSSDGGTVAVSTLVFPFTYPRDLESRASRQRRCEVQLWDTRTRRQRSSLVITDQDQPRAIGVPEMAFSPDGNRLRFWSWGVSTWNVRQSTRLGAVQERSPDPWSDALGTVTDKAPWVGDGQFTLQCRALTVASNGLWYGGLFVTSDSPFKMNVILWHRARRQDPWRKVGMLPNEGLKDQNLYAATLSHNGKYLAVLPLDGDVQLFTTAPFRFAKFLHAPDRMIGLAFSPDDRYLMGCGAN